MKRTAKAKAKALKKPAKTKASKKTTAKKSSTTATKPKANAAKSSTPAKKSAAEIAENLALVRGLITVYSRSGCYDQARLDEMIVGDFSYYLRDQPVVSEELRALIRTILAGKKSEEATWREATMNDRIDRAFAQLDKAGIIALQNAGQTMSAGWEDTHEARRNRAKSRPASGGCFYHQQDLEKGVADHGLNIAFGAFVAADAPGSEAADIAVGKTIVDALAKNGVATEWGGTPQERISIPSFVWQKRMFTKAPKF